ncbi:hypothetical protein BH10PSE7_BH10PSE7_15050 [soil metagenome]
MNPSDLLTIEEALERWPRRFTANELRDGMRRGLIGHVRKSGRNWLTIDGLEEYLESLRVKVTPCQTGKDEIRPSSSLMGSGSSASQPQGSSIGSGTNMTPELEEYGADQLAQKILNGRKKNSLRSSPRGHLATPSPPRMSS